MSLETIGIDHVQITVPRALETDCLAFYRGLFGTAEIEKPLELKASGGAWFQFANLQLHIGVDAEASAASKPHVCFLVRDVERTKAELEGMGIPVQKFAPVENLRRFFIRDPAGNRIEIGQR